MATGASAAESTERKWRRGARPVPAGTGRRKEKAAEGIRKDELRDFKNKPFWGP